MLVFFGQTDYNSDNKPKRAAGFIPAVTGRVTSVRSHQFKHIPASHTSKNRPKHPIFPDNNELFRT